MIKLAGQVTYNGTSYEAKTYVIVEKTQETSSTIYTTKNYSEWNVVKQTDTTVTLLSKNPFGYAVDSSWDNYYYGFVYDEIKACPGCQFISDSNLYSYKYNNSTATVPTIENLSEILTISGDTYAVKQNYNGLNTGLYSESMEWAHGCFIAGVTNPGMLVNINGTNKILPENSTVILPLQFTYNEDGSSELRDNLFMYRPVITLFKSEIPDQSQFN